MYKLSYEKCVCFIFLVILVFLSCSGFHTDRLVTLTDQNKRYPFTSSSYSFNEHDNNDFVTRIINSNRVMEERSSRHASDMRPEQRLQQLMAAATTASVSQGIDHQRRRARWTHERRRKRRQALLLTRRLALAVSASSDEHQHRYSQVQSTQKTIEPKETETPSGGSERLEPTKNHRESTRGLPEGSLRLLNRLRAPENHQSIKKSTEVSIRLEASENHESFAENLETTRHLTEISNRIPNRIEPIQLSVHHPFSSNDIHESDLIRERRAVGQRRDERKGERKPKNKKRRNRKDTFCPGQDVGTRAFHAKTIIEGRVRSSTSTTNRKKKYAVTLEVKKVHKDVSEYRKLNINETIRLHFAIGKSTDCKNKMVDGLQKAQLGKDYIFFLDRIGTHNYTVLGQPVPVNERVVKEIHAKVKEAKIIAKLANGGETVRLRQGRRLKLVCAVRGAPPPLVSWTHNNTDLQPTTHVRIKYFRKKSVLVIPHVQAADGGRYECVARGAVGEPARKTADVAVHMPVTTPSADTEGSACTTREKEEYCLNGGTCLSYPELGELVCKCADGFNGQRCDHKDPTSQSSMYSSYCKLGLSNTFYC